MENEELKGLTPRLVESVFDTIKKAPSNLEFTVQTSYMEIYMEKIRDLLNRGYSSDYAPCSCRFLTEWIYSCPGQPSYQRRKESRCLRQRFVGAFRGICGGNLRDHETGSKL
jgi:hypothetical protein